MNRLAILLRSAILLMAILQLSVKGSAQDPSGVSDAPEHPTSKAVEVIRQAVLKYKLRELKARGYMWREDQTTRMSFRDKGTKYNIYPATRSDSYEVISLAGDFYRRHLTHNDRVLPEQEDALERQWLEEALRKSLDEGVRVSPLRDRSIRDQSLEVSYAEARATADPQLAEPQSFGSEIRRSIQETVGTAGGDASLFFTGQAFKTAVPDVQLPVDQLPDGFDVRLRRSEILNGRTTYVLDAVPKTAQNTPDKDAGSFEIRIWIDQAELEIVKTEQKAIRQGIISSRPLYVAMDWQNYPQDAIAKAKNVQYDQSLLYEPGTVITREWTKFENETWMLSSLVVKGEEIFSSAEVSITGKVRRVAPHIVVEHERRYSDYQKFRVHTRIVGSSIH